MPAEAVRPVGERNRDIGRMLGDHRQRQGARPRAEAAVRFLQGDDVGIDLTENVENAVRATAAIRADRLAHIVARNQHHTKTHSIDRRADNARRSLKSLRYVPQGTVRLIPPGATATAAMMEPRSGFYTARRLRLHYLEWGDPAAPPVILIHGGRDHARSWDAIATGLADRYRVIVPTWPAMATATGFHRATIASMAMSSTSPI